jgi:hypothetical protein
MFSSWVKSGHTTLKSKNDWVIVCPKVETRGNVPKNPNTRVTVEIGHHLSQNIGHTAGTWENDGRTAKTWEKRGKTVSGRPKREKTAELTVESAETWENRGKGRNMGKRWNRPKRGKTVVARPKRGTGRWPNGGNGENGLNVKTRWNGKNRP